MENKEPSGGGAAKQEAASEEYKKEAEKLLELHRQNKIFAPSVFFGILSAYLLFVGAVTGVGMLASYSHHETTANVFLVISIPLLLIAPIAVTWYLLVSFRKKPTSTVESGKQRIPERIMRSLAVRLLTRLLNNPIFTIFQSALYILTIALAIIRIFPKNPRIALALIVTQTVVLVYSLITLSLRWFENQIKQIWEFNELARDALVSIAAVVSRELERNQQFKDGQLETNKTIVTALKTANLYIDAVHNVTKTLIPAEQPVPLDASPGKEEERNDD